MHRQLNTVLELLPASICRALNLLPEAERLAVTELRLRAGNPSTLTLHGETFFLSSRGGVTKICDRPILLTSEELQTVYLKFCRNSVYARSEELRQGFVTYAGCRAGLCGEAIVEKGEVIGFRNLSAMNIRIAQEHRGCASELLKVVLDGGEIRSTLVASPPGCGKTTLLRDLCRLLALRRFRVAIIDERGELAGDRSSLFDLGGICEVLKGIPKAQGMELALRTLSPQVMVLDELGGEDEVRGMLSLLNAGVPVVASCHAVSFAQLEKRPQFQSLCSACAVSRVVILEAHSKGQIKDVVDLEEYRCEASVRDRNRLLLQRAWTHESAKGCYRASGDRAALPLYDGVFPTS